MDRPHLTRHWRTALVAIALVAATAGGAGARAVYDADNARRVGGWTHPQMSSMSIPPQAAHLQGTASMADSGPSLGPGNSEFDSSSLAVSFVVPRDHDPARPLTMRVSYIENSPGACAWMVAADGLEGPDGPNTVPNVHNGGWTVPGQTDYDGPISVPAGAGSAHVATLVWPFDDAPGMFITFKLTRQSGHASDTCGSVQVTGLRLSY